MLVVLLCSSCSGEDESWPGKYAEPASGIDAEGADAMNRESTDEFARRPTEDPTLASCVTTSSFELDEPTPLGFSAAAVLANAAGRFEVPISWASMCEQSSHPCPRAHLCDGQVRPISVLAGTETTLSVEIEVRAQLVEVSYRTPAEPPCGESMFIPVVLRVETADGALDELFESFIVDANLESRHAAIGALRAVVLLQGGLARDAAMPSTAELRMGVGFYDDRVWMEIEVLTSRDERPAVSLLSGLLPPFDTCVLDMPRDQIVAR
jgi:hypothetical protein